MASVDESVVERRQRKRLSVLHGKLRREDPRLFGRRDVGDYVADHPDPAALTAQLETSVAGLEEASALVGRLATQQTKGRDEEAKLEARARAREAKATLWHPHRPREMEYRSPEVVEGERLAPVHAALLAKAADKEERALVTGKKSSLGRDADPRAVENAAHGVGRGHAELVRPLMRAGGFGVMEESLREAKKGRRKGGRRRGRRVVEEEGDGGTFWDAWDAIERGGKAPPKTGGALTDAGIWLPYLDREEEKGIDLKPDAWMGRGTKPFAWGSGARGQVGQGLTVGKLLPAEVTGSSGWRLHAAAAVARGQAPPPSDPSALGDVTHVYAGPNVTYMLNAKGEVKCLGQDACFRSPCELPTVLPIRAAIRKVSCGVGHCMAVDEEGGVWSWGENEGNCLGLPVREARRRELQGRTCVGVPSRVTTGGWERAVGVAGGMGFSAVVSEAGDVYAWGLAHAGQTARRPASGIPKMDCAKVDGPWGGIGVDVACCQATLFVLGDRGDVWVSGWNADGQCGLGDLERRDTLTKIPHLPPIRSIAAGQSHVVAAALDGRVWTWGSLEGMKDVRPREEERLSRSNAVCVFVSAGSHHSAALTDEGRVWVWGSNMMGQLGRGSDLESGGPAPVVRLDPVCVLSVACGGAHTVAVATRRGSSLASAAHATLHSSLPRPLARSAPLEIAQRRAAAAYAQRLARAGPASIRTLELDLGSRVTAWAREDAQRALQSARDVDAASTRRTPAASTISHYSLPTTRDPRHPPDPLLLGVEARADAEARTTLGSTSRSLHDTLSKHSVLQLPTELFSSSVPAATSTRKLAAKAKGPWGRWLRKGGVRPPPTVREKKREATRNWHYVTRTGTGALLGEEEDDEEEEEEKREKKRMKKEMEELQAKRFPKIIGTPFLFFSAHFAILRRCAGLDDAMIGMHVAATIVQRAFRAKRLEGRIVSSGWTPALGKIFRRRATEAAARAAREKSIREKLEAVKKLEKQRADDTVTRTLDYTLDELPPPIPEGKLPKRPSRKHLKQLQRQREDLRAAAEREAAAREIAKKEAEELYRLRFLAKSKSRGESEFLTPSAMDESTSPDGHVPLWDRKSRIPRHLVGPGFRPTSTMPGEEGGDEGEGEGEGGGEEVVEKERWLGSDDDAHVRLRGDDGVTLLKLWEKEAELIMVSERAGKIRERLERRRMAAEDAESKEAMLGIWRLQDLQNRRTKATKLAPIVRKKPSSISTSTGWGTGSKKKLSPKRSFQHGSHALSAAAVSRASFLAAQATRRHKEARQMQYEDDDSRQLNIEWRLEDVEKAEQEKAEQEKAEKESGEKGSGEKGEEGE